jgi:hypothetical protein
VNECSDDGGIVILVDRTQPRYFDRHIGQLGDGAHLTTPTVKILFHGTRHMRQHELHLGKLCH